MLALLYAFFYSSFVDVTDRYLQKSKFAEIVGKYFLVYHTKLNKEKILIWK